jgi:hypothetical protein
MSTVPVASAATSAYDFLVSRTGVDAATATVSRKSCATLASAY